ncbi:ABC transporter F family member 4-like [Dorcoceras hygrometricum]|uniref:ABC transporter F family member 4-like n=1 Tax=Dorcoceras hygrometricum TaxID=472368 RepID=A0A2Z7CDI6_9LAMI|nr:ABC transporter F family member 4-like [Dorcoceras hygrometricum]
MQFKIVSKLHLLPPFWSDLETKKERLYLYVSAMLATMESYTDDIDLPSSAEEDDEEQLEFNETNKLPSRQTRSSTKHLDIVVSEKELKKREKL